MTKTFIGQCPLSSTETSIDIDYVDCSTLDSPNLYTKGRFSCEKAMNCPHVKDHTCSIYNNAPNKL